MIPVEIKFPIRRPLSFLRAYTALKRQVATEWNDLTAEQLVAIADVLHTATDVDLARLNLLKILLSIPWYRFLALGGQEIACLEHLAGFIMAGNTLTRNLLPRLRPHWFGYTAFQSSLYGPADGLANIRFNEFVAAESYFMDYQATGSEASLNGLIAVLYRPIRDDYDPDSPSYNGDIRQNFNDNLVEKRIRVIGCLPLRVRLAILHWYVGCRLDLVQGYENVFSGDGENAKARQPWLTMIRHVPSDKFGRIEQIEAELVHNVLFHLDEMMDEAKQQQAEMEARSQTR